MGNFLASALTTMLALAAVPAAPPTLPARPGDPGVFLLRGGARLSGTLVEAGPSGCTLELRSGERLRLPPDLLVGRLAGPEGWSGPVAADPHVVIETAEGAISGQLLARADGVLVLRSAEGATRQVPEASVLGAAFLAELPLRRSERVDAGRTRYAAARPAGALSARQWALRSSLESALEGAYGVTDALTLSAGLETPLLYGRPTPPANVRLDATGNLPLGPARLSAGATAVQGQGAFSVTLHAELSVGSGRTTATVFAGPPIASAGRLGDFDAVVMGAAGTVRLWGPAGLVGEVWTSPRLERARVAGLLAFRGIVGHLALDVGALVASTPRVVPWVAISIDGGREAP